MYFGAFMARLDVILPAYNPLPGWEENVIRRFTSLQKSLPEHTLHLVIVNDGSQQLDENQSLALLCASIPDMEWVSYAVNRGKGYALREGVRQSTGDFIIYTDIDWPYTEKSMVNVIRAMTAGADAAIGTRDAAYYTHLPPARRRISRWLRVFNGRLLHLKVDDTQAGLKGFHKNLKELFLSTTIDRYLFDLEFIYLLSRRRDIRVKGIPVMLREGITFSKMRRKILFGEAGNFLKIWLGS